MPRPALFRVLLQERHWDDWAVFAPLFEETARNVGKELSSRKVELVTLPRRTFDHWFSGDWFGTPHRHYRPVLERLLGHRVDELFSPAPDIVDVRDAHGRSGLHAALLIAERWPTSRLYTSVADVGDVWELAGRSVLDGTTTAVQIHPASRQDGRVTIQAPNSGALQRFLRPARRGLIVGVDEHSDEVPRMFVADTASARLGLSDGQEGSFSVPCAYELDDLTYGILWSLIQFDDGLLADDQVLDQEQQALRTYLSLPRSAPSRMALPVLTSASSSWIGSAFCAQYIHSRLEGSAQPPVFWTREQTGEQAAAWLFFSHKVDYLRDLSTRFGDASTPLSRMFVIPESEVAHSDRYERILLFLAIALMELYGIRVQATARPEFSAVDGFALVPGNRAVVANWVRTEAVWSADTTARRPDLRRFQDYLGEAGDDSLLPGADRETRLRTLAEYLRIDWGQTIRRCRELGENGVSGLIRPRSRLLTISALDEVLHFLGTLAPDQ